MAKFDWGFEITNKETAAADCILEVYDRKTDTIAHFSMPGHTGDTATGDCIYEQYGFRMHDAVSALTTWGWI